MVSLQANAAGATFRAFNLMVVDGGAPTGPLPTSAAARGSVPASGWDTVALTEATNLDPDKSYVFFVGVRSDNFTGQGGTAQRIRCQLTVSVTNRNL